MGALPDDAIQDIKIAMLEEELKIIKGKLEETN